MFIDLKPWGKGCVRCHALHCLSATCEHQNGISKGSVKIIHLKFLPGLAPVCSLASAGHLQKGLAEPKLGPSRGDAFSYLSLMDPGLFSPDSPTPQKRGFGSVLTDTRPHGL